MSEASNSSGGRSAACAGARRERSASRSPWLPVLGLLGACIVASRAGAQEPVPSVDAEGDVASELAPSSALAAKRTEDLSPEQQLAGAKTFVGGIEHAAQSIQRDLQSAQNDR